MLVELLPLRARASEKTSALLPAPVLPDGDAGGSGVRKGCCGMSGLVGGWHSELVSASPWAGSKWLDIITKFLPEREACGMGTDLSQEPRFPPRSERLN